MKVEPKITVLAAGVLSAGILLAGGVIEETVTLAKGWNAIYLESTPETADCDDFFQGMPVKSVGAYLSDAYSETAQYRSDGRVINQKPVSYFVWIAGNPTASTLKSLAGGQAYLVFTTNDCSKTFYGTPKPPVMSWRATDDTADGLVNISGPSVAADVSASAYYGEGPHGTSGTAYVITGEDPSPSFLPLSFLGKSARLHPGQAYALTATRSDDWSGVIRVSGGDELDFGTSEVRLPLGFANCGGAERVFRFTYLASERPGDTPPPLSRLVKENPLDGGYWTNLTVGASWERSFAPGEERSVTFGIDRRGLAVADYGALLQIEDLGGSGMRVRIPVSAEAEEHGGDSFPAGLWIGSLYLNRVSEGTNMVPVAASGVMKPIVLMHLDGDGVARLLQRVGVATDTNGTRQICRELAGAKAFGEDARLVTSLILDPDNSEVAGVVPDGREGFGDMLQFSYTVAERAGGNPFRHAWHPDHDGVSSDYTHYAPSGDDLSNYVNAEMKPELWSVTNTLSFVWKDDFGDAICDLGPEEKTAGYVRWRIDGLANRPVVIDGTFAFERIIPNGELK